MNRNYFAGMVAGLADCLDSNDPEDGARGYLESFPLTDAVGAIDADLGFRTAMRHVRDHGVSEAVDLLAARLWKWGAEEELDELLAMVGMGEREDDTWREDAA